jgi:hypothetical protein
MRQNELRALYDAIVEKKQVEVECALSPTDGSFPAKLAFDLLKQMQQWKWFEICFGRSDGV